MTEPEPVLNLGSSERAAELRRQLEERSLPENAYAQRRAMLIMAALTFATTWGGVRLSSIEALGVKIAAWNERYLVAFGAVVLAYLIGNFAAIVRPLIVAWKADVAWFELEAKTVLREGSSKILEALANMENAFGESEQSGPWRETIAQFREAVKTKLQPIAKQSLGLHWTKVRWEYQVPVVISMTVLYLAILRIVALAWTS